MGSEERLSWIMDREKVTIDWMIVIGVRGEVHGTYSVHKTILAIGRNKRGYFSSLFKNKSFAESDQKTSRIELHNHAADAIPVFLD